MASPGGVSTGIKTEVCVVCDEVKGSDKVLECDVCNRCVHTKCGKVTNAMYSELKKATGGGGGKGIKFFCIECDKMFESVRIDLKQMIDKQLKLESKQNDFEEDLEEVKRNIEMIKTNLKKVSEESKQEEDNNQVKVADEIVNLKNQIGELKVKYSDVARVGGAEGGIVVQGQQISPGRSLQLEVSEVMEREKRKNNLVIFGIEETDDENLTKNKINEIITEVGMNVEKVKYFGRVGRRVAGAKPRVVRIVCEDSETKRSILKGANKLKGIEGFQRIYLSLDLTKEQQANDKKLRDKLKEIRVQHKEAKISNGEIIVFQNGNRIVLYPEKLN